MGKEGEKEMKVCVLGCVFGVHVKGDGDVP